MIAYSYDAAGRLIGSQHVDHAHRYSVDAAGNLVERQQPNGERLTLGYDGANRLVHLIHASELGATREATYRYDGLGRRISKTVRHTTATTHYGWDGDRIVREETDNQRTTVIYEPGSFVPMLRIDDTEQGQVLSAYITDALGTPMQLVTPNGQPRWLAEPDDWAAVKNQRAVRNVTQPIRFQGQWHDEESGLYYNRHRYYDPQQGRYISQDPIGLKGGGNLYGYVGNPTGMVDPLGLEGIGQCAQKERACAGRPCSDRSFPSRADLNNLEGVTEALVINSEKAGTGWKREHRDAWHNMGVEPGTNRKYTNIDGREAVFTTNTDGLSVHVTDHNGPTYNYGRNDFTHTLLDVVPYFFEGAGSNDTSNLWDRITICTIGCSLD